MGFDVGDTKATFVDESFRRSDFWFVPIIVAQINFNQNLDWFYQLLDKFIYIVNSKILTHRELLMKLCLHTS